nr:MAG TPA: capsid protein [Caudoviricetes sp.]
MLFVFDSRYRRFESTSWVCVRNVVCGLILG